MFELAHDLRATIRGLLRRPAYPAVAVVILALGLSAFMAVVTWVNAFFQPFPGVDADRLVRVFGTEDDDAYQNLSYLDFLDYADAADTFEGLTAAQPFYLATVRLETMTDVTFLEAVSGGYFSVLGVRMVIGRGLTAADDRPGADPAAVISHEWWQRSFAGAASLDPGFAHDSFVASMISTSSTDLEAGERGPFLRELKTRLAEEPWVQSAAVADWQLKTRSTIPASGEDPDRLSEAVLILPRKARGSSFPLSGRAEAYRA